MHLFDSGLRTSELADASAAVCCAVEYRAQVAAYGNRAELRAAERRLTAATAHLDSLSFLAGHHLEELP